MRIRQVIALMLTLGWLTAGAQAADAPAPDATPSDRTPPRLSFVDGQVSFWRPGAQDWAQAQVNTPLTPGDELATASPGNLEVQIGARAFVRAWANTQVGLANQEPDFLQVKVTTGTASFDVRTIEPGRTVEVDTPHAAFTIERAGYYRVDVTGERTAFITRRGGRATVTPGSEAAVGIAPSEEVIIEGPAGSRVASYAAPPLDVWDRWNYARTDHLLDAVSARYVSPDAYGVSDLDRYGAWRVVPTYGAVWVPTAVPGGWVPYSTGAWMLDPFYGWTWVDTAPWGWAPYHYGRWVSVDGFWAWTPGPVVVRPVYAPALVAFFGGPGVGVSISIGGPVVGWVALGWGEPVVPWWGREGFIHEPSWRGWGGPRVVNNTVINNTTVVNVQNINVYRNSSVRNAVVVVHEDHFGHGPITSARAAQVDVTSLRPTHTAPQIATTPASFVPTASRGVRPPEGSVQRPVVATRAPHAASEAAGGRERNVGPAGVPTPAPRLVSVPPQRESSPVPTRPTFGQSTIERPTADRAQPPSPPGAPKSQPLRPQPQREPQKAIPAPATPQPSPGRAAAPPPPSRRPEAPQVTAPAPATPQTSQSPAATPPPPAHRPEAPGLTTPAPVTPPPSPGRAAAPAPLGRRPEAPQVTAPAPVTPPPSPGRAAAPAPSGRRPEAPAVTAPAPVTPAPPGRAAAPPPPARRPEPPAVAVPAPVPPSPSPGRAPTPPPARAEAPRFTTPTPPTPQPSSSRAATPLPPTRRPEPPPATAPAAPQPPARRAETPHAPSRPLPGEPANRLAPNRGPDTPRS
jgi:uncharacterized protein DUF6600